MREISWLTEDLVATQEGLFHGVSYRDYSKWSIGTDLEGKIQVMIWNTIRLLSEETEEKYELSEPKIKLSLSVLWRK
jgi:hypothetical protein